MEINQIAQACQDEIVEIRRYLHQIPELGYQEFKTTEFIHNYLLNHNIPHRLLDPTGALAFIEGHGKGPVWAIRADIDALPIQENSGEIFSSRHPGRMHACGHDAHTAIALVLARVVNEQRANLNGALKVIFQPNEEGSPTGAPVVINQDVMNNPKVNFTLAFHVDTNLDSGIIGLRKNILTAYVYNFDVTVIGRGGHAARPNEANDPIVIASEIIMALQTIASRFNNPNTPLALTVGQFQAGTARNIIPEQVEFKGTLRLTDAHLVDRIKNRFLQIINGIASANEAQALIQFNESCPAVINDLTLVEQAAAFSSRSYHLDGLTYIETPSLGGDDFAFYLQHSRGAMFRLGVRDNANGITFPGHHPQFRISESHLNRALALYLSFIAPNP